PFRPCLPRRQSAFPGVDMDPLFLTGAIAIAAILGAGTGVWAERMRLRRARRGAEDEAARIIERAREEAAALRRDAELAGREAAFRLKEEWEKEEARRREELVQGETRLDERRSGLDRKFDLLGE